VNNREIATAVWLSIGLLACFRSRDIRRSLWQTVKLLGHWKVAGPLVLLLGWTAALVADASEIGVWDPDLRGAAITWLIAVGVPLLLSLDRVHEDNFFLRTARRAVAGTVFVEAFVNLVVLPLPLELIVVPVATFLGMLVAFSEGKEEYAPAYAVFAVLSSALGFGVLIFAAVGVASDFHPGHTLRALALPVWLTLGAIPYVYVFGLVALYESAFLRIDFQTEDATARRRAKRALVRAAHVRAATLGGFAGHWIRDLAEADSPAAAKHLMRRWRRTWRIEDAAERLEVAREYMTEWLGHDDPDLGEVFADAFTDAWHQLDTHQRKTLKAEGLRMACKADSARLEALPD
jgi:hypothetical protein